MSLSVWDWSPESVFKHQTCYQLSWPTKHSVTVCWHPGLLQVLLPLLLALAALHGHLEQPPAPHAQPEEQGLQLEQMDPNTLKGQRKSPSRRDEAARQGEHVCRTSLGTRAPWHSTRHWGYHCRKCSLLHLLHFCCCSQWHYAQWLWERQGALHTYAFSQTCGQTERWESA